LFCRAAFGYACSVLFVGTSKGEKMSEYVTTIGNRTLAFTDDHLKIDSFVIPYGEMSKIGFRSGEKPGFVFQHNIARNPPPL